MPITKEEYLQKAHEHAKSKGGVCLSTEYKNAKTKLDWQCKNNHVWQSDYDHAINRNRWCKQCSYDKSLDKKFDVMAEEYAKHKGGSVILPDDRKVKTATMLTWKCANTDHKPWISNFRNIVQKGSWCPYCAGKFSKEEYLQKAKEYAISKGGECLSTEYIDQNTKLTFKCHNPNHAVFNSSYDKLIPANLWCKECKYEAQKPLRDSYLEKAKKHAESRGGQCLSKEYINNTKKLTWHCGNHDHPTWEASYNNVVGKLQRWCPTCAGQLSPDEWIKKAHKHAESRGGKFLSDTYTTVHDSYLWKCNDIAHKSWSASINNVFNNNTWCPDCGNNTYYKENNTRVILEYVLGFSLKKSRPEWNINPNTKSFLELDGYNEEYKFAFEFQGRHHFEENVFKNTTLEDVREKDEIKKENCKQNNVFLLIINDVKNLLVIDDWVKYILNELEKNNINFNRGFDYNRLIENIIENNKSTYKNTFLDKAKMYAESKGGECLSQCYINYNTPLLWKCNNKEHKPWEAGIGIVDKNTWCPRCVGKFSKSEFLEKAKKYAESKGGNCLSTEYVNNRSKLEWKCHDANHPPFLKNISIIVDNSWCMYCNK